MKARSFVLLLIGIALFGCNTNNKPPYKTKLIDYGSFTMEVPVGWKPGEVYIEDSAVGQIQVDSNKFIGFDLGAYSNPLNEDNFGDHYTIEDHKIYLVDKSSTSNKQKLTYYSVADSADLQQVRQSKVEWIKIDGYPTKLLVEKIPGKGITGIYIADLWNGDGGKANFQISSPNLSSIQQLQFIAAIKTLKFYANKRTELRSK